MSLKKIKNSSIFNPIYNVIAEIYSEDEITFDKSLIVFNLKKENKPHVQICFWLEDNRVSCFVEEFEFIDEYIDKNNQSLELRSFLKTLLSNTVKVVKFKTQKNQTFKRQIYYSGLQNKKIKIFDDTQFLKFMLPWGKSKREEILYEPWLGVV
jgi:hypothetical protein